MKGLLTIGEFSRTTHLSIAALRHYHELELLPPAAVDPVTGYRRYSTDQIPRAQLVRRLRDLAMPLGLVKDVLEAPDESSGNAVLLRHLERMERHLESTREAVASLRSLIEDRAVPATVVYRTVPPTPVFTRRERVDHADILPWCASTFPELAAALDAAAVSAAGPGGALFADAYFEDGAGEVTAFVPIAGEPRHVPETVEHVDLPGQDLAVAVHAGPYADLDRTYGALGSHVGARGIGAGGYIREHYLVTPADSPDPADLRTEVCWPVTSRDQRIR